MFEVCWIAVGEPTQEDLRETREVISREVIYRTCLQEGLTTNGGSFRGSHFYQQARLGDIPLIPI